MTIITLDIPKSVLEWYTKRVGEMGRTGSKTTLNELLVDTLILHTAQVSRPGGQGAFTPNTYTLPAHDEVADFPAGAGY